MVNAWSNLEDRLFQLNVLSMARDVALAKARETLGEVRSGSGGTIEPVEFKGPLIFLRVVGKNRVYGGQWWFEESLLHRINQNYSRIFFGRERRQAIRVALREVLALSFTWNKMTEVWALKLPIGEKISGYRSAAVPQSLFHGLPISPCNRLLSGGAQQIFFPAKNPLWIEQYGSLEDT